MSRYEPLEMYVWWVSVEYSASGADFAKTASGIVKRWQSRVED